MTLGQDGNRKHKNIERVRNSRVRENSNWKKLATNYKWIMETVGDLTERDIPI